MMSDAIDAVRAELEQFEAAFAKLDADYTATKDNLRAEIKKRKAALKALGADK